MKIPVSVILFIILGLPMAAQNIISTNPAVLQVFAMKTDGSQVVMTCQDFDNQYDQLKMSGELVIRALKSEDRLVQALLDSTALESIRYTTIIPEGQFVFHETIQNTFTSEAVLMADGFESRFIMNFEISNRKTSASNNFDIICTGTLSLKDNLGITGKEIINDNVSFRFFQNVKSITY